MRRIRNKLWACVLNFAGWYVIAVSVYKFTLLCGYHYPGTYDLTIVAAIATLCLGWSTYIIEKFQL